MSSTIISLANQKGGVGKTTTATAMASIFAERGNKTLLLDNDPQGNASQQLGLAKAELKSLERSTSNIYLGSSSLSEAALETNYPNLYLVAAGPNLSSVETNLPGMPGSDLRLRQAMEKERTNWDIIFIDNAPNVGKLSINALVACDWYLIPMDAVWGLDAVGEVIEVVNNNSGYYATNNQLLGIVLTLTDRTNVTKAVRDEARARYTDHLLESEIRRAKQGREAAALGQPVTVYDQKSDLAQDYYALADEISARIGFNQ